MLADDLSNLFATGKFCLADRSWRNVRFWPRLCVKTKCESSEHFIYDPQKDEYRCLAGQALIWHFASIEKGMKNHRYWSSNCSTCPLKAKCTPSTQSRVTRWEHQGVLDDMQTRLEQSPNAMSIRHSTVEHPYGTIKVWMGSTHFLTKGLERVKTEMSLHVLAYNLKRLIVLLSIAGIMEAIRAYALFLWLYAPLQTIILIVLHRRPRRNYSATGILVACQN